MSTLSDAECLELALIAKDLQDGVHLLHANHGQEYGGITAMLTSSALVLVAEEALNYFGQKKQQERIGAIDRALFDRFAHSVTKVRSRLKLLDDTDKGAERLIAFLALIRQQSRVLFSHPTSRIVQWLSGPYRPDLGAFFVDEHLVGTTHSVLPMLGFDPGTLAGIESGTFRNLNEFSFRFAQRLGTFCRELGDVLAACGYVTDLAPEPQALPLVITCNDFVGDRFYRAIGKDWPALPLDSVATLVQCLAHANTALHLLPVMMPQESLLLLRIQYLTAYHGMSTLRKLVPALTVPDLDELILSNRKLRNMMAHYELRIAPGDGQEYDIDHVVQYVANASRAEIASAVRDRLTWMSTTLGAHANKASLCRVRALLGEHS